MLLWSSETNARSLLVHGSCSQLLLQLSQQTQKIVFQRLYQLFFWLFVWFVNHARHGAGELFSILITTLSCHCWVLTSVLYNLCYLYGNSGITAFFFKLICVLQLFCNNGSVNKADWLTVNKFFVLCSVSFVMFTCLKLCIYFVQHYLFTFQFHFSHNELSLQVSPNMFTSSTVGLPGSSWHHTVYQIFKLWQHEFKMNLSKANVVKREIEKLVISLSSCYFCQIDIISACPEWRFRTTNHGCIILAVQHNITERHLIKVQDFVEWILLMCKCQVFFCLLLNLK